MDARSEAALDEGIELFNRGEYHAALDAFELPYHEAGRAHRPFFLALIRAAAALYHLAGGRPIAAGRLYASSRELLTAFAPEHMGLDIQALGADLVAVFAPAGAESVRAPWPPRQAPRMRRRKG